MPDYNLDMLWVYKSSSRLDVYLPKCLLNYLIQMILLSVRLSFTPSIRYNSDIMTSTVPDKKDKWMLYIHT